jgi:hypothetical protein
MLHLCREALGPHGLESIGCASFSDAQLHAMPRFGIAAGAEGGVGSLQLRVTFHFPDLLQPVP